MPLVAVEVLSLPTVPTVIALLLDPTDHMLLVVVGPVEALRVHRLVTGATVTLERRMADLLLAMVVRQKPGSRIGLDDLT